MLGLTLAAALLPQQAQAPTQLRFDAPLAAGQETIARVSSAQRGAPAWLAVGPAGHFSLLGLGQPSLAVQPLGAGRFVKGQIAANGQFEARFDFPSNAAVQGQRLSWQAGVRDPRGLFWLSPRVEMVAEASRTASWIDRSDLLAPVTQSLETSFPRAHDFDGDGDVDVIMNSAFGLLYLDNQAGSLVEQTGARFPSEIEVVGDFCAADLDGDADLDLVLTGRFESGGAWQPPVVLWNDGSGHFLYGTELPSALERGAGVITADIEGDGDLDILMRFGGQHSGGGASVQSLALFLNEGGAQGGALGTFVEDFIFATDLSFNNDAAVYSGLTAGDVDLDGDIDLVVGKTSSSGAQNDLLLNLGNGRFKSVGAQQLPSFRDKSGEVLLEDFTGDGYLDIYVCNSHWTVDPSDSGDLLINRGVWAPGTFDDADATHFPDQYDENLIVRIYAVPFDIEGDGDRDLVVLPHEFMGSGGGLVGHPALFVNQGGAQGGRTGSFVEDPQFWLSGRTFVAGGAVAADFDLDGDSDFLVTSIGGVISTAKVQDFLIQNQTF